MAKGKEKQSEVQPVETKAVKTKSDRKQVQEHKQALEKLAQKYASANNPFAAKAIRKSLVYIDIYFNKDANFQ